MSKWRRQYPDWLYRALPHLYVWGGLLILIPLPSFLTMVSSAILVAAGVTVWVHRYRYRREFNASRGAINVIEWSAAGTPSDGSLHISWRNSFECGHPLLDGQHRRLFGLGNELVSGIVARKSKEEMEPLIGSFIEHMKAHLETESVVLHRAKISGLAEWQKKRNFLVSKAQNILENFHLDELTARELVGFVTYDVVVDHIIKSEIKLMKSRRKSSRRKRSGSRDTHANPINPNRTAGGRSDSELGPNSVWGETYFR